MAKLSDGREVPFDDIGVLAPGGGTRGITAAGAAEQTRQRFANTSLPTRALGMALGAAETIVPAAGSPKETLRTMAKAARDWIVTGQEKSFGIPTIGAARVALEQGYQMGTAAAAGDPHAQGALLATAAATAFAAPRNVYKGATLPPPPSGAIDYNAIANEARDLQFVQNPTPTQVTRLASLRGQLKAAPPMEAPIPFAESAASPNAAALYEARGIERRRAQPLEHPVDIERRRGTMTPADLQAKGFMGMGAESMTPADVAKMQLIGEETPFTKLQRLRAKHAQHTAETILPKVEP